ncbi:MAG: hypothetical protein OEO20_17070 [Gemmatimonadota bacterium]|nr:hypothetical protein [Gemmatimonadota bacterium]MDH5551638.1 hypothetical protein [Gemmatimonadota bacterium]
MIKHATDGAVNGYEGRPTESQLQELGRLDALVRAGVTRDTRRPAIRYDCGALPSRGRRRDR